MFQFVFASCLLASLAAAPADEKRMVHVDVNSYAAVVDVAEPSNVPDSGVFEVHVGKTAAKILYDKEEGHEKQDAKSQKKKVPVMPNAYTVTVTGTNYPNVSSSIVPEKGSGSVQVARKIWYDGDDGNMKDLIIYRRSDGELSNNTSLFLKNINNRSAIIEVENETCWIMYVNSTDYHLKNLLELPKDSQYRGEQYLNDEKVEHWQNKYDISENYTVFGNNYIKVQEDSARPVRYLGYTRHPQDGIEIAIADFEFSASKPPASEFKYDTSKCKEIKNMKLGLMQENKSVTQLLRSKLDVLHN